MNTGPRLDPTREPLAGERRAEAKEGATLALTSDALLQGQKAVTISHNGSVYRLQATRQGKLILTK
jgi:hemin uptake protein HemP